MLNLIPAKCCKPVFVPANNSSLKVTETPSLYTKDSLKAYKSLDGYRMYADGWVSCVRDES